MSITPDLARSALNRARGALGLRGPRPSRLVGWLAASTLIVAALTAARPAAADDLAIAKQERFFEVGFYLGAVFPSDTHELYDVSIGHRTLADAAVHFGARLAYMHWAFLGVEIEGGGMPTKTENDENAALFAFRAHLVLQFPARFAPFAVVGGGLLGVASSANAVGDDVDGSFHIGLGVKFYATKTLLLRLDARQNIGGKVGPGGHDSLFEVLFGVSVLIGGREPEPGDYDEDGVRDGQDECPTVPAKTKDGCPPDADEDGLPDDKDKCPKQFAKTSDGCPPDTDKDGVIDAKDSCPKIPAKTADGCPGDSDGDGLRDHLDKCPKVPAKTKDGCPPPDRDKDGIIDAKDKCPDKPETKNGFQDSDGCPDVVPKIVKRFTGAIRGIYFAYGKAKIRKRSFPLLDKAVKVLTEYKSVKLLIRGHTDSRGKDAYNLKLSKQRAQAVVDYMVGKGVAANRLSAEGVGSKEPAASNKTAAGRAKNRRIEFKIVTR